MSLEYTKHTHEKNLHRNLPSVRDILTLLLHCSLMTPNQPSKQSFETFVVVSLDDAVTDPWMQATRYGRVDFAEVCCNSDSLLSGAVTAIGGRAVQYSHSSGFDLTKKAGTEKLKEDLLVQKSRVA